MDSFKSVVMCRVRKCANNKCAKQIVKLIKIAGFVRFFKLSSKMLGLEHVVENL